MGGRLGWTLAALAVALVLGGAWLLLDDGSLEPAPGRVVPFDERTEANPGAPPRRVLGPGRALPATLDRTAVPERLEVSDPRSVASALIGLPLRRVHGVVVRRADASAIVQALVSITVVVSGAAVPHETLTDGQGAFELDVPLEQRELRVEHLGRRLVVDLPDARVVDEPLRVVFDSGHRVDGRVLDADGEPVAGALVGVTGLGWATTTSGADGDYVLHDVGPPGRASARLWAQAVWCVPDQAAMTLPEASATLAGPVLRLHPAGVLEGRVRGPGGIPARGAVIVPRPQWLAPGSAPVVDRPAVVIDRDGNYRLAGLSPGVWRLEVQPLGDLVERWVDGIEVEARQATTLDIDMHPGARIAGSVRGPGGELLQAAQIRVEREDTWIASGLAVATGVVGPGASPGQVADAAPRSEGKATTGATGRFVIVGLSPGPKRLIVTHTNGAVGPLVRALSLDGAERVDDIDLSLPAGLSVEGTITDPDGAPVVGAGLVAEGMFGGVSVRFASSESDDSGRFELGGLPPGAFDLAVAKEGWYGHELPARTGDEPLSLVLRPAPRVSGRVVTRREGLPVERFEVTVTRAGEVLATRKFQDGQFELAVEDEDLVDITVTAWGFRSATLNAVLVRSTVGSPLVIELEPVP